MPENEGQSFAIEMQKSDGEWERVAYISREEEAPLSLTWQMLVDYIITSPGVGYRAVPIAEDELPKEH